MTILPLDIPLEQARATDVTVTSCHNTTCKATARGLLRLSAKDEKGEVVEMSIPNCYSMPEVAQPILSLKHLIRHGAELTFDKSGCTMAMAGHRYRLHEHNDLYYHVGVVKNWATVAAATLSTWHRWFCHADHQLITDLYDRGQALGAVSYTHLTLPTSPQV